MKIKITNNWKVKRCFSNGLWYTKGLMFPWEHRKYLHIGAFGFLILIQWGRFSKPLLKDGGRYPNRIGRLEIRSIGTRFNTWNTNFVAHFLLTVRGLMSGC